jgi:hypothetical protein
LKELIKVNIFIDKGKYFLIIILDEIKKIRENKNIDYEEKKYKDDDKKKYKDDNKKNNKEDKKINKKRKIIFDEEDSEEKNEEEKNEEEINEEDKIIKKKKLRESDTEINTLWSINFDQFIRKIKHNSIIEYVKKKINENSADVLKVIIDFISSKEKTLNDENSCVFYFQNIYELLKDDIVSKKTLEKIFETLILSSIIQQIGNQDGGSYILRLGYLNNLITEKLTESIIENKYGLKSARIFRILKIKKYLEQKQIAQIAMIVN